MSDNYDLTTAAPYRVWGAAGIESSAREQMERAVRLPISVKGALMPDAHVGYGLPVGGVLATRNGKSISPQTSGASITV